jgi:hypothetical protein
VFHKSSFVPKTCEEKEKYRSSHDCKRIEKSGGTLKLNQSTPELKPTIATSNLILYLWYENPKCQYC